MDIQTIQDILNKQRKFFQSGETLPIKFRIEMLKKLYNSIIKHEKEICSDPALTFSALLSGLRQNSRKSRRNDRYNIGIDNV